MRRSEKSVKNSLFAIFGQATALIFGFVTRIWFIKILGEDYLGVNGVFCSVLSLLSLTELGGGVLEFLNPSSFAPLLGVIGIVFVMNSKTDLRRDLGYAFLGFTVLITGMNIMSSTVKPLADMPGFAEALTMFRNPLLGIAAGALLTAVIQSSSASVGILQALAASGALTRGAALPIILGQNIGT